jgi:aromatase
MAGHTDNSVVINAPPDFVWDRMNDVKSWPTLFSEYASAEILERKDDKTFIFRLTTHPDPEHYGRVWSWVSERTVNPETRTTKSRRIETGPFEYMNIEWFFEPVDGGTRMRWVQDFTMNPTAPYDDKSAEESLNRSTRVQMSIIKERLEKEAQKISRR